MTLAAAVSGIQEDSLLSWAAFSVIFFGLAAFDLCFLAPRRGASGNQGRETQAYLHCVFWFVVGLAFNAGVWMTFGRASALAWFDGYILEYLLSMDNVFFFHVVFTAYATPADQVYKALFLGILGAVLLRLGFYWVGATFFHLAWVVQLLFGAVLVWSGYQTAVSGDDEDEDPRQNLSVRLITRCLPVTDAYDPSGALLTWRSGEKAGDGEASETTASGGESVGSWASVASPQSSAAEAQADTETDAGDAELEDGTRAAGAAEGGAAARSSSCRCCAWRGTLLLLVVVVLQVVDVLFAVDSVTAKLAEHDGVFVNFSSSAFAMLCLRSLYFVLARLLRYFRFLKYGVACILVLIGVKLAVSHWVALPETASLAVICGVFLVSISLSAVLPEAASREQAEATAKEQGEVLADVQAPAPAVATSGEVCAAIL